MKVSMVWLRKCPFCGGDAKLELSSRGFVNGESCKITYVHCTKCNARTAKFRLPEVDAGNRYEVRQEAINCWNRRNNDTEI